MKMKLAFFLIAGAALIAMLIFMTSATLRASQTDDRITSSAKNSDVFKTYLKSDAIKIQSGDCAVTWTGTVSEESHKSTAEQTVESLPGVKSVNNQLTIEVSWSSTKYLTGSLPADAGTHQLAANPKQTERRIICCGQ